MSKRLTLSAALSVLMMAGFALFGGGTADVSFGPQAGQHAMPASAASGL